LTLQKAELEDINVSADPPDVHDREHSPLLKPMQVGRLSALLEAPEYFKFCFVRNPFTRLLSCYLDKIASEHPVTFFQKSLILRQLGRQLDDMLQFVSFEEFVDAVAAQRLEEMESHWSVQWHHLCEGRIPFDVTGRFENFSTDFEEILGRIGINSSIYFDYQKHNVTESNLRLNEFYDKRLEELVRRVYAADFDHFGYLPDLPI
jgi:dermatan 4-sulfotransferase 1